MAEELNNIATFLQDVGGLDGAFWKEEAERWILRAVEISEKSFGPDHLETGMYLYTLSQVQASRRQLEESKSTLERTLQIFVRAGRETGQDVQFLPMAVDSYTKLLKYMGVDEAKIRVELRRLGAL